ncbi:MAG: hypothetical protein A2136_06335 [Chloroflexi bacterium RBG_16_54_11]|nr:MAG: hypothetical protein A2136_06335 [Chloroflexi bacterium RBG_16_54_11]
MQDYDVSLEIGTDGWVCGWALGMPGCFWHTPDEMTAQAQAMKAHMEFLEWLSSHGEAMMLTDSAHMQVVEKQLIPKPLAGGSTGALFGPERQSLGEDDMQRALRWMDYSRMDLLSTLQELPSRAWDWQPGGEDNSWNLHTHVRHLANVELYYCLRLAPQFPGLEICALDDNPGALLAYLESVRRIVNSFLRSLIDEQCTSVVLPVWQPGTWAEELWSARKVLRRFIYHERFHHRDISQWKYKALGSLNSNANAIQNC